jgi:non-ribosomal peptide synthetase component F
LAVFYVLLARHSGQDDIVIGTPVANRNRSEIEPLVGMFVNTLALRFRLANQSGTTQFQQLLAEVAAVVQQAQDHQDLPFEMLVDELQIERDMSRNPLFQVMFKLDTAAAAEAAQDRRTGLGLEPLPLSSSTTKFDLQLSVVHHQPIVRGSIGSDNIKLTFTYSTDLFDRSTVERMAGHFAQLCRSAVSSVDASLPVANLEMLDDEQSRTILQDFGQADGVGS